MNQPEFNAMLRVARNIIANTDSGASLDPHTVEWARVLIAANPTEKRRPQPITDALLGLFDAPEHRAAGVAGRDAAALTGLPILTVHQMLYRLSRTKRLFLLREPGSEYGRYFRTEEDRDAAKLSAKPKEKPVNAPKPKPTPKPPKMTPERVAFNLTPAKPKRHRVNPDQGGPWAGKPKADREPIIPPGLQIQRCPSINYDPRRQCAPGERPFGAGFSALPIGHSVLDGKPW